MDIARTSSKSRKDSKSSSPIQNEVYSIATVVGVTLSYFLIAIASNELLVYLGRYGFDYIGIIYGLQQLFILPTFLVCYCIVKLLYRKKPNKIKNSMVLQYFTKLDLDKYQVLKFADAGFLKFLQAWLSRWSVLQLGTVDQSYTTALVLPSTIIFEYLTFGYIPRSKFNYLGMLLLLGGFAIGIYYESIENVRIYILVTIAWTFLNPPLNIIQKKRTNELVDGNPVHAVVILSFYSTILFLGLAIRNGEPWKSVYDPINQVHHISFWDWVSSTPECWFALFCLIFVCGLALQVVTLMLLEVVSLTTQVVITSAVRPIIAELVGFSLRNEPIREVKFVRFMFKVVGSFFYALGGLSMNLKKKKMQIKQQNSNIAMQNKQQQNINNVFSLQFSSEKSGNELLKSSLSEMLPAQLDNEDSFVLSVGSEKKSYSELFEVPSNAKLRKNPSSGIFDAEIGQSESLTFDVPQTSGYNTFNS